jgi:hypothetical protein
MLFVLILSFATLFCCWLWADVSFRTKCILTTIYAASWASLFIPDYGPILFPLSQIAMVIVVGAMTFGIDWLSRDPRFR